MRKHLLNLLVGLALSATATAQHQALYEKKEWVSGADTLRYRLLLPEGYRPDRVYPLVLFLHGSGERGRDNEAQLTWGGALFAADSVRRRHPALVVFPQCPANQQWTSIEGRWDSTAGRRVHTFMAGASNTPARLAVEVVRQLIAEKKADPRRIYLGGLSLGGFGAFVLAAEHPGLFAAVFPICGGGDTRLADRYNPRTAWWIFHGAKDNVVDPQFSRDFHRVLQARKRRVRYTEYPEAGHDSWSQAFREPELLPWLFGRKLRRAGPHQ